MQHRLPLNKARRWGLDQGSIGRAEVNFFPGTPVAVRVVDIAAACQEFKIALAAHFHASPLREQTRIKNITLVVSFAVKRGAENKNFAQVARGGIQRAIHSVSHRSDLIGAGFHQVGVIPMITNCEDASFVSRSRDQPLLSGDAFEGQSVHQLVA